MAKRNASNFQNEIGATGISFFAGSIQTDEFNNNLKGKTGALTYDKMRRTDAQVYAILNVIKLPIRSATWYIETEDDAVKEFLEEALFERLDWDDVLRHALLMLDFGFEVMEKVYYEDEGKWWLKKLAHRAQTTLWKWLTDENGDFAGYVQHARKNEQWQTLEIPAERCALFSFQREGNNFEGISLLRACYKHWYIKDGIYRIDAIAHERFGVGVPYAKAPQTYTEEDKDSALALMKRYKAGEQAHFFVPPDWEFGIMGSDDSTRYNPMESIKHHDEMIARAVLATFLNFGTTGTGARATADSMTDLYMNALGAIAEQLASTIQKQIIDQLLEFNFTDAEARLRYADLETRKRDELADGLHKLVSSKILNPDFNLEQWARDVWDLPEITEEDREDLKDEAKEQEAEEQEAEEQEEAEAEENEVEAHEGCNHDHVKFSAPSGRKRIEFWRDPTPLEQTVALREIAGKQEDGAEELVLAYNAIKPELVESLVNQGEEALRSEDVGMLENITVSKDILKRLEKTATQIASDIFAYGRRSVREEKKRQLRLPTNQTTELRDEELTNAEIRAILNLRGRRFADRLTRRALESAKETFIELYRTEGISIDDEILDQIAEELNGLSENVIRDEGRGLIADALAYGRQVEADIQDEDVKGAQYSAILDENLCDECRAQDGRTFTLRSRNYYRFAPPNKYCFGGVRCRCLYVYIFSEEV